jgi:hypothetical protein
MTKTRDLADLGGGFIQAGTGAVQRTVESKLQDVVSVKDFGAVGDGVADDTVAIQAALTYAASQSSGGFAGRTVTIFFPAGQYLTGSLTVSTKASLQGSGIESTFVSLKPSVTTPLIIIPAVASAGDVYYDSGTNKLRCYNGTTWNDLF